MHSTGGLFLHHKPPGRLILYDFWLLTLQNKPTLTEDNSNFSANFVGLIEKFIFRKKAKTSELGQLASDGLTE